MGGIQAGELAAGKLCSFRKWRMHMVRAGRGHCGGGGCYTHSQTAAHSHVLWRNSV